MEMDEFRKTRLGCIWTTVIDSISGRRYYRSLSQRMESDLYKEKQYAYLIEENRQLRIMNEALTRLKYHVEYEMKWFDEAKKAHAEAERYKKAYDDPEMDATDFAHPAWWRSHDHTALVFCDLVNKILDGKDDGHGFNHEPWHSLRRRLLSIRNGLTHIETLVTNTLTNLEQGETK